jgi:hypothetical protein
MRRKTVRLVVMLAFVLVWSKNPCDLVLRIATLLQPNLHRF